MKITIIFFGILLILAGLSLVVDPDIIFNLLLDQEDSLWLYIVAIAVRVILGFFLVRTAASSRYPTIIRVLGIIMIIAAIVLIVISRESFQDLISIVLAEFRPLGRIGGLLGMALGGFLVYAFTGKK